jgi:hypothetical protein
MPDAPVIANNTPLVALWSVGQLNLLGDLYGEVLIPKAVREEFLATERAPRLLALDSTPWLQTVSLANPRRIRAYVGLDQGEAEVLALAEERAARLVIIDEWRGRRYAQRLGFTLTGTLGVLLLAKEQGLIDAVGPLAKDLVKVGLYLKPDLIAKTLELAGEGTLGEIK